MSVVGGGTKLIFCEGQPGSLDNRLLNRLLLGQPPSTLIVPSGGKRGLLAFIQGRLSSYAARPAHLAFRDRDYDRVPSEDEALIRLRPNTPVFLSYRAAVENYLLDASLVHDYWDTNRSEAPSWQYGDSPGADQIAEWMDDAARTLVHYQAVRWSLAGLKPAERWPELETTWTKGSGFLPESLDEGDCLAEAKKLVSEYTGSASEVREAKLVENYQQFAEQFAAPGFLRAPQYLIWFHGKDLCKAMHRLRPTWVSLYHYCSWAVDRLERERYADLRELATMI